MTNKIGLIIKTLFYILLFFTPLIVIPINSELFEFGKIVFLYLITILITFFWITKSLLSKKIIYKKTPLDLPIIIFLFSQIISTYISIDPLTSIFGFYTRFNGGLLSTLSYTLLYFSFVSNMDKKSVIKSLYFLLVTSFLVSIYAVAQHFGIDKNIWVQDVQNRVFSTLGQPNWLAAWIVALIPITITFYITKNKLWLILGSIEYLVLLYTKSRSGIIAFTLSYLLFWLFNYKNKKKEFFTLTFVLLFLTMLSGTPWTPKISNLIINYKPVILNKTSEAFVPALEMGGTESGDIRKIVWKGALDVWKAYPVTGSGVETFAYSFYAHRPKEHNLTSEWDFLYNKAHNEFLNYAANSGALGLFTYIVIILVAFIILFKPGDILSTGLLSGFLSIQVTNFFGFSVVTVSLLFYLLPAMSLTYLGKNSYSKEKLNKIKIGIIIAITIISGFTFYLFFKVYGYWYADILYNKGTDQNESKNYYQGQKYLEKAIKYSPAQPIYYEELSRSLAGIATSELENKDDRFLEDTARSAVDLINYSISISPGNFHLLKSKTALFIKLAELDKDLYLPAIDILEKVIEKSPTDAKIYYNLGLLYEKLGDHEMAISKLETAVNLKSNYKEARYALAIFYKRDGEIKKAKEELQYILKFLSPKDVNSQKMLESL